MKPTMTYELAMAASRDAGNRAMRRAGREQWSREDWNVACAEFERLYGPVTAFGERWGLHAATGIHKGDNHA